MAVQNPPIFIQGESHPAEDWRRYNHAVMGRRGGIAKEGDLLVTQNGTPNMSVNVATGGAFIPGTEATYQGMYYGENRGTLNVPIAASDLSNSRYDMIIARIRDSNYSGAVRSLAIEVVQGTPSGTPVEPAIPANSIKLARVTVGAGVTSITTVNILDLRLETTKGRAAALGGIARTTSSQLPVTGMEEGDAFLLTDTNRIVVWNGLSWNAFGAYDQIMPTLTMATPLTSGTSSSDTVWSAHTSLLTAPYPLRMQVTINVLHGWGGTNHEVGFVIGEAAGVVMSGGNWGHPTHTAWFNVDTKAAEWRSFTLIGAFDYAAGAVCGFNLRYFNISAGTTQARARVLIEWIPRFA